MKLNAVTVRYTALILVAVLTLVAVHSSILFPLYKQINVLQESLLQLRDYSTNQSQILKHMIQDSQVLIQDSQEMKSMMKGERAIGTKEVYYDSSSKKITCEENGKEISCPFRAQSHEDVDVLNYLFEKEYSSYPGTKKQFGLKGPSYSILEIGALDGMEYSTTLFFEQMLDWRAIHFEGARNNFKNLIANRPKSLNVGVAGCEKQGTVTFVDNGAVGGMFEEMSEKFKELFPQNLDQKNQYKVECGPMTNYLKILGISKIDIFVLDVEGAELSVLKGIDLNVTHIHYFIIEEDHTNLPKEKELEEILKNHGFKKIGMIGDGRNGFYENSNWPIAK